MSELEKKELGDWSTNHKENSKVKNLQEQIQKGKNLEIF